MLYAVRVDIGSVTCEAIADWLADIGTGYLAVREGGSDNPHVHIVVAWDKTTRGFRKNFLTRFPSCNGNASYSITEVKDEAKYHRYICKGEGEGTPPTIVARNGMLYTEDWIEQQHAAYYVNAPKKRPAGRLLDTVFDTCKEAAYDWHDRQGIAREYIRECIRRKTGINTFQAKSAVNLITCLLCPTEAAIEDLIAGI